MRLSEVLTALDSGERVRAVWAYSSDRSDTKAVGRIVAFSPDPMVCVETADGERFWWAASLVDHAGDAEGAPGAPARVEVAPGANDDAQGPQIGGMTGTMRDPYGKDFR